MADFLKEIGHLLFRLAPASSHLSLYGAIAWLPESLPAEKRIPRRCREMVSIYGDLLKNRRYLCHALALGAIAGLNFAYIAGAPQFFIEGHGISPQAFGIFFGLNAAGLIATSQINRRLLDRYPAQAILKGAFAAAALTSLLLSASVVTGVGGFFIQSVLIFVFVSISGILFPNVMALALAPFASSAGSASALLGAAQYTIGALAGVFVGLFHNGSEISMALTMTGCALAGSLAFLATNEVPQPEGMAPFAHAETEPA